MKKKNEGEVTQEVKVSKTVKQNNKGSKVVKMNKRRAVSLSDKVWKKVRLEAVRADMGVSEYIEKVLSEKTLTAGKKQE